MWVDCPLQRHRIAHWARSSQPFDTYVAHQANQDAGVHHLHANVGLSFPTGSINERDKNPMSMGNNVRLPYPMQNGSGTYDFLPGLTYIGKQEVWSWGAQASGVGTYREPLPRTVLMGSGVVGLASSFCTIRLSFSFCCTNSPRQYDNKPWRKSCAWSSRVGAWWWLIITGRTGSTRCVCS